MYNIWIITSLPFDAMLVAEFAAFAYLITAVPEIVGIITPLNF
jgi:hypothetical protein